MSKINIVQPNHTLVDKSNPLNYTELKNIVASSTKELLEALFFEAVKQGIIRDVRLVLPEIITYNIPNCIDKALCMAIDNYHMDIMVLLLESGANVNYNDDEPLYRAVETGQTDSVEMLLKHGANARSKSHGLIFLCCQAGDYPNIINLLIQYGADIRPNYHTCLGCCYDLKHTESSLVLIQNGNHIQDKNTTTEEQIKKYLEDEEYFIHTDVEDQISSQEDSEMSSDEKN